MTDIYTLGKALREAQRAPMPDPGTEEWSKLVELVAAFDKALAAPPVVAGEHDGLIAAARELANASEAKLANSPFAISETLTKAADALAALQARVSELEDYERSANAVADQLAAALGSEIDIRKDAQARIAALTEALTKADQFITNGIELGFISMPDADTPDSAHDTLPAIRAALKGGNQ